MRACVHKITARAIGIANVSSCCDFKAWSSAHAGHITATAKERSNDLLKLHTAPTAAKVPTAAEKAESKARLAVVVTERRARQTKEQKASQAGVFRRPTDKRQVRTRATKVKRLLSRTHGA